MVSALPISYKWTHKWKNAVPSPKRPWNRCVIWDRSALVHALLRFTRLVTTIKASICRSTASAKRSTGQQRLASSNMRASTTLVAVMRTQGPQTGCYVSRLAKTRYSLRHGVLQESLSCTFSSSNPRGLHPLAATCIRWRTSRRRAWSLLQVDETTNSAASCWVTCGSSD